MHTILIDNSRSIKLAENIAFDKRTKRMAIKQFYHRRFEKQANWCWFCASRKYGADILTKALPSTKQYKSFKILVFEDTKLIFE